MTNKNLLKILFVEDLPSDAELAVLELIKGGLKFEHTRVDTREDFINTLHDFKPDIVISDYLMPAYNGLTALHDKIEFDPHLPFILLTGSINEEIAVQCMKAGATDYIIKEHMTRLPFAVKEALEQTSILIEKRAANLLLKENEEKIQSIFRSAPVGIGLVVNRKLIEVNDAFCSITGYSAKELIGKSSEMLSPSGKELDFAEREYAHQVEGGRTIGSLETEILCKDGKILNILLSASPLNYNEKSKGYTIILLDISSRKKAEAELQHSEERYRTLYNEALAGLYRTKPNGEILLANNSLVKMLGFNSFEEMAAINLNNSGFSLSVDRSKFIDIIEKEGEIADLESIWKCSDGSEINVRESAKVVRDADGKTLYYDGTVENITEKKRATQELKSSLSIMNASLESTADGILIVDGHGAIIKWNEKFSQIWGLTDHILNLHDDNIAINRILDLLINPDNFLETVRDLYANPEKLSFDTLEFKDGRTVERFSQPQRIDDKVVGRVWSFRDITERKKMESSLLEKEERYRELFMNNPYPTYIFDSETLGFIEVNDATVQSYGYSREEFASMTLKDLRLPEDIPGLIERVKKLGSGSTHSTDMRHRRKDGTVFPIENTSYSLPEKNGRKTRLSMSLDITERVKASEQMKLAKEKAEASDKLKTTFLNNISHEVRTPLNGILGFAEIVSQSDLSEQDKKESLKMLTDSSDRLLNTITNYMDISLLTSASMSVYQKDFLPDQILKKLFNYFEPKCKMKGLELYLELPPQSENMILSSDSEMFQKIISHLLNNAIKFTEKGGVKFGFRVRENELEFFITDTGVGIGKESYEIIFDHFVKEDRGPLRLTEGSGLGLSISKGMVEILGGKIRLDSELDKGSSFFFTIPVLKEEKKTYPAKPTLSIKQGPGKYLILVAEDDEANFLYIKALLKKNTMAEILHAANGKVAVEKYIQNPGVNVILMDIKMPVMNGLEATRQIKAINPAVPVIAITAYAMSGDEARIMEAGCDYYLTKPLNKNLLLAKLAEYVR
jgi:PAS domain S-box-containing protein